MEETTHNSGAGFETTDVHVRPIGGFIIGLIGLMVFGIVIAVGVFYGLKFRDDFNYAEMKPTALQEKRQIPNGPLLQVTNHDDLLNFRAKEAKEVGGHATWLDKNAKVVRLPIDRAIDLVAERGLPVFKGTENSAAPAAPEAKK
jgi:hypothetical protein